MESNRIFEEEDIRNAQNGNGHWILFGLNNEQIEYVHSWPKKAELAVLGVVALDNKRLVLTMGDDRIIQVPLSIFTPSGSGKKKLHPRFMDPRIEDWGQTIAFGEYEASVDFILETKYVAKPDTWYDEGTSVKLIDDYGNGTGLFRGVRTCKNPASEGKNKKVGQKYLDEEVCLFEEFNKVQ